MGFRKFVYRHLRKPLLHRRIALDGVTNRQDLERLFSILRPVETKTPLIRLGDQGDGGYLVPDDLEGIAACFSPGVSVIADFEQDMVARNIPCYLADYSVDSAPISGPLIHFEKKFIGPWADDIYMPLDDWAAHNGPSRGDLVLQMDIEGAEYGALLGATDTLLNRFRIMVIEFHELDAMFGTFGYETISAIFQKLTRNHHLVHIHPNNFIPPLDHHGFSVPPLLEMTFLRKDRAEMTGHASQFPHPLDQTTAAGHPDFALPACWWQRD